MSVTNENLKEQIPSGSCSPVLGWSPLPPRRHLNFVNNEAPVKQVVGLENDLYPNCDVSIWLRSCETEIITPLKGEVKGDIPSWLNGSLIRNGPGSLRVGDEEFTHLFDSSALLHRHLPKLKNMVSAKIIPPYTSTLIGCLGFCLTGFGTNWHVEIAGFGIKNGEVTYQCRFLDSEIFRKNSAAKRIVMTEFGTRVVQDPCQSIFKRIAAIFKNEVSDNAMISVYPFGDKLYAFNEIPVVHQINSETLETEDKVKIDQYVSIVHHTSHPHVLNDGTVYNLGLSVYATGLYHTIVRYPKIENGNSKSMFQNGEIVATIPARWTLNPSYMHSFGITDNYYIIVEQPLSISVPGIITSKFKNEPLAGCFRWFHEEYTRISVVSRSTGKLYRTFYAESFFYLHIINQYESENDIVIDICIYKDPYMLDCMYVETMKSMQQNPDYAKMFRGRPARFVLPINPDLNTTEKTQLHNGKMIVKPEKLCNLGCETPRINYESYLGKPYRYFYAISADVDADNPGTLIKVDTQNKSTKTWGEKNCYPSEPIFVPSPGSTKEDEGIILSAMVWGREDTNHVGLLVLDGQTFTELGRAEFKTQSPVPKCLHGWFLAE